VGRVVSGDGATMRVLADGAVERPTAGGALDWVGMGGIALPVAIDDPPMVPARVDASNLMFCEDAARRLAGALAAFGRWSA